MIQETSLQAYEEVKKTLSEKQFQVWKTLKRSRLAMTNTEIADYLHWSINRVTPRVNELVKLFRVEMKAKRFCKITGRRAIAWGITGPERELF